MYEKSKIKNEQFNIRRYTADIAIAVLIRLESFKTSHVVSRERILSKIELIKFYQTDHKI